MADTITLEPHKAAKAATATAAAAAATAATAATQRFALCNQPHGQPCFCHSMWLDGMCFWWSKDPTTLCNMACWCQTLQTSSSNISKIVDTNQGQESAASCLPSPPKLKGIALSLKASVPQGLPLRQHTRRHTFVVHASIPKKCDTYFDIGRMCVQHMPFAKGSLVLLPLKLMKLGCAAHPSLGEGGGG